VAAHYGVDPKMTVRTFNKMQAGLTAMAKPEKEAKSPDRYQNWRETFKAENGRYPNAKEEERFGKTDAGAGRVPVGHLNAVSREVVSQYFPHAKKNLDAKGLPGVEEAKNIMLSLNSAGEFGGSVAGPRVREGLSDKQRAEFDFVGQKAEEYAATMSPKAAVKKAQQDWADQNPAPKTPSMNQRYNEMMAVDAEIRNHGYSQEEMTRRLKELHAYGRKNGLIQ
jgi:hypothetical protein